MSNDDEKDLLTRELRERSADVDGSPIAFAAVRQSARRIRRRRTIVTGAVAAMVAGVALPTGLAVTSALNSADRDRADNPDIATSPTADATAPAPTPRPDGTFALTLRGLPKGEPPRVSYVVSGASELVTPESRIDLPEPYSQIVPFKDGWMALGSSEQEGRDNIQLDPDLDVVDRTRGGEGIVLNADGSRLLYVQRDFNVSGRTVLLDRPATPDDVREPMTWDMPTGRWLVPVGYLGPDRAVVQAVDGEEPYIAMAVNDADPHVVELDGFSRVTAVSEALGLVAGVVSYDDRTGTTCSEVVEPVAGSSVWQTCAYEVRSFSPDGTYAVAAPSEGDGLGPSSLVVLHTSTWKPVVEFTPARSTVVAVQGAVWEDEDTVAAVVVEGDDYGIVRAELDGRLELTTTPITSVDLSRELWFADLPGGMY